MNRALAATLFALLPVYALAQDDHQSTQLTIETAPNQAQIELVCRFSKECFETEACSDTEFKTQLSGKAGGLTPADMVVEANLITDAETTTMLGLRSDKTYSLSGGLFDARHLLTIAASGAARYTVHLADGPMVITYHGKCEGQS